MARKNVDEVDLRLGVEIPLRDGVRLSATVYLPKDLPEPAPCTLSLTPYMADTYHMRGRYFAERGLPTVIVNVRGRGGSEGTFRPFHQEGRDGYDVVEWIARQQYCNGKVGMWGGSYNGYVQWATAREFPPHLATIVPTASPYVGRDFPMRNNIFQPYAIRWITLTRGAIAQWNVFGDDAFWSSLYRRWHESGRAFRELDALLGDSCPLFQEWLDHPCPDEYWDACNPTAAHYAALRIPVLTVTGAYDDDQPGALAHYTNHMRSAPTATHYLVIGPWDHQGAGTPSTAFGGITVGPASLIDLHRLHLDWYDWAMGNGTKPRFLEKRVAYYVMGADEWRYADALAEIESGSRRYFLDSSGSAADVFASGSLGLEAGRGPPDSYRYDPADTHGAEVEAEAECDARSVVDQSVLMALRGKALFYHSAPFDVDTDVSGFFKLRAWLSLDCPDTDIYVSVYEVARDGSSIRLATDAMRARYREGLRVPKLIESAAPLPYDFDRFTFVARRIERGNRLRLVIAPIGRIVEATFAEKNYNGGGVVAAETAADARPVTVTLFHDAAHPSALHVPLERS
jgi:putative CocE/NonD family hydrolase